MAANQGNSNGKVKLTFLHPRDSSEFRAEIGTALRADQVIGELVKARFIEPASGRQGYALQLQRTGAQIPTSSALGSAGVQDGDSIAVTQIETGAAI